METADSDKKLAGLEALLFIHGEPLTYARIGTTLNLPPEEVAPLVQILKDKLWNQADRGLAVISDSDKAQLMTKPEFHNLLESFVRDQLSDDLSPASLETLAIVAYFGPISRSRIEYQRGVNSIFILRNLLLRGLVERSPDPEHPQSFLYRPTFEFWRQIGIRSSEELPEYDKFKNLIGQFENQNPGAS